MRVLVLGVETSVDSFPSYLRIETLISSAPSSLVHYSFAYRNRQLIFSMQCLKNDGIYSRNLRFISPERSGTVSKGFERTRSN
jgi:hypothetical protein